ncbi:MAG: hypothetical protein K2H06_03300 [Anaeroplasmataceae bacterium]|nr:hypothetical protein [Anaeroplasmataceae bacterium]
MLIKLTKEELEKYIDFAYEISLDLSKSCYPTYADGIKTKKDFIEIAKKSFEKENDEIYLFYYEDKLEGWIHYYYIPEDQYFACETFSIQNHMDVAFEEFFKHIEIQFRGYEFYFGCSINNKAAIEALKTNGFEKIEESQVCLLDFDDYKIREENKKIKKITKENYNDFRTLHSPYDEEMYWNCDHLLEDIDNWYIYVLYENKIPVAAIYFVASSMLLEIFGIDYKEGIFNDNYMESLMTKALNQGKSLGPKHMYYFAEEQDINVLKHLGFKVFDTYVCYLKRI